MLFEWQKPLSQFESIPTTNSVKPGLLELDGFLESPFQLPFSMGVCTELQQNKADGLP